LAFQLSNVICSPDPKRLYHRPEEQAVSHGRDRGMSGRGGLAPGLLGAGPQMWIWC